MAAAKVRHSQLYSQIATHHSTVSSATEGGWRLTLLPREEQQCRRCCPRLVKISENIVHGTISNATKIQHHPTPGLQDTAAVSAARLRHQQLYGQLALTNSQVKCLHVTYLHCKSCSSHAGAGGGGPAGTGGVRRCGRQEGAVPGTVRRDSGTTRQVSLVTLWLSYKDIKYTVQVSDCLNLSLAG